MQFYYRKFFTLIFERRHKELVQCVLSCMRITAKIDNPYDFTRFPFIGAQPEFLTDARCQPLIYFWRHTRPQHYGDRRACAILFMFDLGNISLARKNRRQYHPFNIGERVVLVSSRARDKEPGDNRPIFEGRLSLPDTDAELHFPLWGHEYADPKTGEMMTMFNGSTDAVSPADTPKDQVAALLKNEEAAAPASISNVQLRSRQVVLFPNRFKDEAPGKERPDYWGAYNPDNGQPIVRISVWMRKDRYGRAMLTGATSYPLPGKSEIEQQDAAPTIAELEAQGMVSRGMPEIAKKRGKGRGE